MANVKDLEAFRKHLRKYTTLKYSGDCKCGNCQLVPIEDLNGTLSALAWAIEEIKSARLEALEEAAKWHEKEAEGCLEKAGRLIKDAAFKSEKVQEFCGDHAGRLDGLANLHKQYAANIRVLKSRDIGGWIDEASKLTKQQWVYLQSYKNAAQANAK